MKYWRGYLTAAFLALFSWGLITFAKAHGALVDMIYPYATRMIQDYLAAWGSGADFCLWQMFAVLLIVIFVATIILMIVLRWNFVQWAGWVLAGVTALGFLHTGVYGLNSYCSPLSEDIRLDVSTGYTITELADATVYFRDQANALAVTMPRDEAGQLDFPSFEDMAKQAGDGFHSLVFDKKYSVFAGSTVPVKKLGLANMYTSMGISGFTMPLTGEAAVNPQTPAIALPFTMGHEMAHRMCIAPERDANLAGFLSCQANSDPIFQYSGYFMAFRFCYNALAQEGTSTAVNAANEIYSKIDPLFMRDLKEYSAYYSSAIKDGASGFASSVNDTYIKASGDKSGVNSYGEVTNLLVSWYLQEIYLPAHKEEEVVFDPLDKNQVDLSETTKGAQ